MNYYINTYGCQMNIHESEKLAGMLEELGYTPCAEEKDADIILFNTCCIRETAEQKIYGRIGTMKKLKLNNKNLIVALCGCMTQQEGVQSAIRSRYPYVDIVLGTGNISMLPEAINKVRANRKNKVFDESYIKGSEDAMPLTRTSAPNAWVNIIYGCNNFCSYCIVPYVRGRERSRSMSDIVAEVKKLVAEGYKEITLLGQNVNSYGNDLGDGTNFAKLLNEIGKIEGKFRVRFMSSHPKDLTQDVIDAVRNNKNICNSIHLPVQSGSNDVLRRMNRRYTRERYLEQIRAIRESLPDVGITTDIMVGFPGETEQDFQDTLDLVRQAEYSSAFCFIYSRRKGTPAYSMENQIPYVEKQRRIQLLLKTQNEITKKLSSQMQGKVYEVLAEDINPKYPDTYCGRTENGRLVNFRCDFNPVGQFVNVVVEQARSATLWGRAVKED